MPEPSLPLPRLPRAKGTALHHQLFLALRGQILEGEYTLGAMLPTEDELCARYGVSRITVRRTLSDLEAQGLVERQQGRGTFVRAAPARTAATLGLIDSLRQCADSTQVEVLHFEHRPAPTAIAQLLDLATAAQAMHVTRLRRSGRLPVMLTDAWIPDTLGARLTRAALQKAPLYELLMKQGVQFGRVVQEITAIAADASHAQLLQVGLGVPLLKLTRLLYDGHAEPVQHLTAWMVPERNRLLMDVMAKDIDSLAVGHILNG